MLFYFSFLTIWTGFRLTLGLMFLTGKKGNSGLESTCSLKRLWILCLFKLSFIKWRTKKWRKRAKLRKAKLWGAKLWGAKLWGANRWGTNNKKRGVCTNLKIICALFLREDFNKRLYLCFIGGVNVNIRKWNKIPNLINVNKR